MNGTASADWWDNLDQAVLDREVAASFENGRIFPDEPVGGAEERAGGPAT